MSGGDGSQIQIGEKTRKNKPGRVHSNKPETGLTEEGKSSDYLRSLLKTHGKELPPKALLSILCLSPSARCWLSLEVKTNPNYPRSGQRQWKREALIKSESFRERFWKNPQVSRWGFQASPHSQPLLEVTPGQLGSVHQRGSSSSHTEDEIKFLQLSPHLNPPHPWPEPTWAVTAPLEYFGLDRNLSTWEVSKHLKHQ